jgi:hypothetical protein
MFEKQRKEKKLKINVKPRFITFLSLAYETAPDGLFALLAHETAPDGLFALLAHETAPDGLFALPLRSFLSSLPPSSPQGDRHAEI